MLLCAPWRKLRFLTLPSPRKVNPPLGNAYEYWSAGLRTLLHGLGRACSSLLGFFSSRICTVSECMRVVEDVRRQPSRQRVHTGREEWK